MDPPGGDVTLRLEVRGDGAIGLVDGKPGFVTPLAIPQSIAYGWWSVAPFSPELGLARARRRARAGTGARPMNATAYIALGLGVFFLVVSIIKGFASRAERRRLADVRSATLHGGTPTTPSTSKAPSPPPRSRRPRPPPAPRPTKSRTAGNSRRSFRHPGRGAAGAFSIGHGAADSVELRP